MAKTPAQNDALMREINEAVRRDEMEAFARRWGVLVIGLILAMVLALGGWLYWRHVQTQRAEADGERYATLLASAGSGKLDQAALTALKDSRSDGYSGGAGLIEAATLSERGDRAGAIAAYGRIAADKDLAEPYRNLALVRQVALEFDRLPPQQVIDRLKPLAQAGDPWFGSAGEMAALAYLKLNKPDLAGALYAALAKDPGVPRSIQTRAVQMASLLGVDANIAPRPGESSDPADTGGSEEQAVNAD